ncbi:MAG: DsbA family protein [Pseudomonadota bacterium]
MLNISRLAVFGVFSSLTVAGCSAAEETPVEMSREAIEDIVREYILENPELILEAVQKYAAAEEAAEEQAKRAAVADLADDLKDTTHAFAAGAPADKAKVTIVEFSDFNCGYCKAAVTPVMELIEKEKDVRFVFRELPILAPLSEEAAKAALAARSQDRYMDYHIALLRAPGRLSSERLYTIAEETGLNPEKLKADMKSAEVDTALEDTFRLARAIGLNSTPSFIVIADGYAEVMAGWSEQRLQAMLAEARK